MSIKKSFITVFILCFAFLLQSFAPAGDNPEVTKDELYEHVKYLASDELAGRFPGTEGDKLAENYIANEFGKYGLSSVTGNGYRQQFQMVTEMNLGKNNSLDLNLYGEKESYEVNTDFIPYGFTSNGKANGKLVFAGYGITAPELNYDDYKDKDGSPVNAEGKILIMFRNSPAASDPHDNSFSKYEISRLKAITAKDHKAAGIIFVNGYDLGEEDYLVSLVYDRVLQDAGIPVIHVKRSIIENIFKSNGLNLKQVYEGISSSRKQNTIVLKNASASMQTNVIPLTVTTSNMLGFLEGSDPVLKNEVVVIGAHFDHLGWGAEGSLYSGKEKKIHHGADDNGSGTAGVLELAQKFSSNRGLLKRSILFMCFSGEEEGLLGSAYFTRSPEFAKLNITSMINMDMVGRLKDNKLQIFGTGTSPYWEPNLKDINSAYNFDITYTPDGYGPSDHSSFYVKDIPVLMFFSGTHPDYHRPEDTYDKINYAGEQEIVRMVYDIALRTDTSSSKPEFTKVVESNDNKTVSKFSVSLGVMPDYSYSDKGLRITDVRAGGPADKAGLKGGDIILKMGAKEIGNIYDYMQILGEHKDKDEVEVIVLRNGEQVTLTAILEGTKK